MLKHTLGHRFLYFSRVHTGSFCRPWADDTEPGLRNPARPGSQDRSRFNQGVRKLTSRAIPWRRERSRLLRPSIDELLLREIIGRLRVSKGILYTLMHLK